MKSGKPLRRVGFQPRKKPMPRTSFQKPSIPNQPGARPVRKNEIKRKTTRKRGNKKLLRDYHAKHPECLVCERPIAAIFPVQENPHHFGLGANRIDDVHCIGSLCGQCHNAYHLTDQLPDEVVWWFKQLKEPENFDIDFLWKIRPSKAGVEPTPPNWKGQLPPWIN